MSDYRVKLKTGLLSGVKKAWSSFTWISRIVLIISFPVALLQWSGWLNHIDFLLKPVMSLINLPPEAALPIISGMLINIYAAIAVITTIPFSIEQMTLIAIFSMIAHNLILEGIIQQKSGIKAVKAVIIRIAAAIVTVFIVSQFFNNTGTSVSGAEGMVAGIPLIDALKNWALNTLYLLLRVLGLIMAILIVLEISRALGFLDYLIRIFAPVMKVFGLSRNTAMLWLAGAVFGLLYGSAVIMEEAKKGELTREELEYLHISVGINHAMMEDPALFLMLGLPAFWLWIPRCLAAIVVVHFWRAVKYTVRRLPLHSRK
jgi:spore maturation protein SpmB